MKYFFYFLEWILEFILIIIHFPTYILLRYVSMRPKNAKNESFPDIILVERWFRKNIFHFFAKWYLEKKGFRVYSVNFPLGKDTFEKSGAELKQYIIDRNLADVILVGISGGALTCLELLQNKNGWDYTKKFISVAGPFHGSFLAGMFPIDNSVREMEPGSTYLTSLFKHEIKNKDKIYSIHGVADNMVPVKSSFISGTHNITVDVVGHNVLHGLWMPTYDRIVAIALSS